MLANLEREITSLKSELDHVKKCKLAFCTPGRFRLSPFSGVLSVSREGGHGLTFMNTYHIPWPVLGWHSLAVWFHSILSPVLFVGLRPISFTGEERSVQEM